MDLAENARRRSGVEADLSHGETLLQTRSSLLGALLLLRCDLLMVSDILRLRQLRVDRSSVPQNNPVDFSKLIRACVQLGERALESKQYLLAVQTYLIATQYYAFNLQWPTGDKGNTKALKEAAIERLDEVRSVMDAHPNVTRPATEEYEGVKLMLAGGTFYQPVSSEE